MAERTVEMEAPFTCIRCHHKMIATRGHIDDSPFIEVRVNDGTGDLRAISLGKPLGEWRCSHPAGCVQLRPHRHVVHPNQLDELVYDDVEEA